MKRVTSFFLLVVLLVSIMPLNCFAADMSRETKVVQMFEDGSYIIETIQTIKSRASGTVTGNAERTYYGSAGMAEWTAILTGTFTYTGSSSTCTSASCSVTIYDSAWYTISKNSSKSGNTAHGSVTMGKKLLGVTVDQISTSLSLSCDKNGNLS